MKFDPGTPAQLSDRRILGAIEITKPVSLFTDSICKSLSSDLSNFTLTSKNLRLTVTRLAGSDFLINVPRESDWNAIDVWTPFKVRTWCEFHPLSRFFVELLWNLTVDDVVTRS